MPPIRHQIASLSILFFVFLGTGVAQVITPPTTPTTPATPTSPTPTPTPVVESAPTEDPEVEPQPEPTPAPRSYLDGHPQSLVNRLAHDWFFSAGGFLSPGTDNQVSVGVSYSNVDGDGFDGHVVRVPIAGKVKALENLGINIDLPLSYTDLNDESARDMGALFSFPVVVSDPTKGGAFFWQLTPGLGGAAADPEGLEEGGTLGALSLSNVMSMKFGAVQITMGNFIGAFEGSSQTISGTDASDLSQQVLKNGLKAESYLGEEWHLQGYVILTNMLSDALVDDFVTIGAELSFRPGGKSSFWNLGFYTDLGSGYQSGSVQLGSGWKF